MLNQIFTDIFSRDLAKLKEEITLYGDESKIWLTEKGISNSAGNLCLHLIGNLNYFIGATLGKTGYVRNRDSEFALKNIPRQELLTEIDKTIIVINSTLSKIHDPEFQNDFPLKWQNKIVTTNAMLLHLISHLNYHLGQINYHRRLIGS